MFEKQKAKDLAELWLKNETCRDPDKLMNEQRMAAFLLLALAEIEELQQYREHHEFAIAQLAIMFGKPIRVVGDILSQFTQLQTALSYIAVSTGCTCTADYECTACRLREIARIALESESVE